MFRRPRRHRSTFTAGRSRSLLVLPGDLHRPGLLLTHLDLASWRLVAAAYDARRRRAAARTEVAA